MSKRENPYTNLLRVARQYAHDIKWHNVRGMFTYPKARLGEAWTMTALAERVSAADQLGWDVMLKVRDGDLHVEYHKRVTAPMELQ